MLIKLPSSQFLYLSRFRNDSKRPASTRYNKQIVITLSNNWAVNHFYVTNPQNHSLFVFVNLDNIHKLFL